MKVQFDQSITWVNSDEVASLSTIPAYLYSYRHFFRKLGSISRKCKEIKTLLMIMMRNERKWWSEKHSASTLVPDINLMAMV